MNWLSNFFKRLGAFFTPKTENSTKKSSSGGIKTPSEKFPPEVVKAAIDGATVNGVYIFPSVALAQWALESNYGKAMPAGSNNPFGIKAVKGQSSVSARTKEVIGGKTVTITAKFAKYSDMADAFRAHNKLLATSRYYAKARATKTPDAFAKALTGVYATDPKYHVKLIAIMDKHNLRSVDR